MKIIVSSSPNESTIYAKVEKQCVDNADILIFPMLMSCQFLSRLKDRKKKGVNPNVVQPTQKFTNIYPKGIIMSPKPIQRPFSLLKRVI